METEKYGHVSIARSVEYDFFAENEVAGSVKLNRFGEAFVKINDEEQPLISNFQNGNFSFSFTKSGNRVSMQTEDGIRLTMNGMEVRLRIPNPPFGNRTEGLCGNNNGEKTDDYKTREGEVLPFTPSGGYTRSDSEFQCAKSWIMPDREVFSIGTDTKEYGYV